MYKNKYFITLFYFISRLLPALVLIFFISLFLLFASPGDVKKNAPAVGPLKLAVIGYSDTPVCEDGKRGIKDGLKQLGLLPGRDYLMSEYSASSDISALNGIVDAVSNANCDLVFAISTPALQAALKKIHKTPIVFSSTGDPIGAGAGRTFSDHAANVTGICSLSDFSGMVKLVREISPDVKKIGTVFCPSEINSVLYKNYLKKEAEAFGLSLEAVPAGTVGEFVDAANSLCAARNVGAICQIADNLSASSFAAIVKPALQARIPVFGFIEADAKKGAALSYAKSYYQGGIDSAKLAFRILKKHEKPADIPFEYISETTLTINKKAAGELGLKIPKQVIDRANAFIE